MAGDKERLKTLATKVFADIFKEISLLCAACYPERDPHLMTVSIFGLVIYHYQTTPIRPFFPGSKEHHNDPEIVSQHISTLLENTIPNIVAPLPPVL